jgi:hypothetical protein
MSFAAVKSYHLSHRHILIENNIGNSEEFRSDAIMRFAGKIISNRSGRKEK